MKRNQVIYLSLIHIFKSDAERISYRHGGSVMAEGVVFPFPSLPLNEGRTYGQPEVVLISLPQVATGLRSVSYTHLDVYKRQTFPCTGKGCT